MTDRGRYMHTSTGKNYFPFDPRPEEVEIEMIAHHLATCARFNGATQHKIFRSRIFYSVAEHSILVSRYIEDILGEPQYALEGLLHDSSEGPLGDLIRPLKYSPDFHAPFKKVEEINEAVHAKAFGLIYPYPKSVKIADEAVVTAELRQIVPGGVTGYYSDDTNVAPYQIEMLEPYEAKHRFLDRYEELMTRRAKYHPLPEVA